MTLPTAQWRTLINIAGEAANVPPDVLEAMVTIESGGNPRSRSPSDARGLCQLIPRWHADGVGKQVALLLGKPLTDELWYDPEFSLRAGALHLRWCYDTCSQSWDSAMAKYLSGECAKPSDWTDALGTTTNEYVRRFRVALEQVQADVTATEEPTMTDTQRPYILVTAGHRSTTDPGNPIERERTDDLAIEYVRQLRAAGYTADWWQRDLDRDSNPTMTIGGLDTVARGAAKVLASRPESLSVLLDLHYNGPHSPMHVIVPDTVGLSTAYNGGAPAVDTAANNTLDVRLATTIGTNIVNATGLQRYNGRLGVANVMSERDTGVGEQYKARLAMFAATAQLRMRAVRLVIEHGGYEDAPTTRDNFEALCAKAVVDALNTVFDVAVITPPKEDPEPVPDPEEPDGIVYPVGLNREIAALLFGATTGSDNRPYAFDPSGPVSQLWLAEGATSGRYPQLDHVFISGTAKYFIFSDGSVIYTPDDGKAALRTFAQAA